MMDISWTGSYAPFSVVASWLVSKVEIILCETHPLDGIMCIYFCCWFIVGNILTWNKSASSNEQLFRVFSAG